MAPEILAILAAPRRQVSAGYAEAVDWWSLGGLVYKLLFGKLPFRVLSVEDVRFQFPQCIDTSGELNNVLFGRMFGVLDVEADIARDPIVLSSSSCSSSTGRHVASFIHGLICIDPASRLGYKGGAAKENIIRSHPFLKSVDWELLEKKQFPPPYLPVSEVIVPEGDEEPRPLTNELDSSAHGHANRPPTYSSFNFDDMLHSCGKADWVAAAEAKSPLMLMEANFPGMGLFTKGGRSPKEDTLDARRHRSPSRQPTQNLQIPEEMQEYFATWRYVSPSMIDNEEIQYAKSKGSAGGRLIRTVLGLGEDSISTTL
jgi:serine/threonine protein kinase